MSGSTTIDNNNSIISRFKITDARLVPFHMIGVTNVFAKCCMSSILWWFTTNK